MINYLVTRDGVDTIDYYLESWGRDASRRFNVVFYDELHRSPVMPEGVFVFSDIERLTPSQVQDAAAIYLRASAGASVLLNHPIYSMKRYELLRTLYERGINSFNVYRLTEYRRPGRFPVFLRHENEHGGALTDLLYTQSQLDDAIASALSRGTSRDALLITEFVDTSSDGIFRKFSAFIVGGQVIPWNIFFSRKWMVNARDLLDEGGVQEELEFIRGDARCDELKDIFALANIQYGRMDYGLLDGRVQVWEINTNPLIAKVYGLVGVDADLSAVDQELLARLSRVWCGIPRMLAALANQLGDGGAPRTPHANFGRYRLADMLGKMRVDEEFCRQFQRAIDALECEVQSEGRRSVRVAPPKKSGWQQGKLLTDKVLRSLPYQYRLKAMKRLRVATYLLTASGIRTRLSAPHP
jgi:hypothetical protein